MSHSSGNYPSTIGLVGDARYPHSAAFLMRYQNRVLQRTKHTTSGLIHVLFGNQPAGMRAAPAQAWREALTQVSPMAEHCVVAVQTDYTAECLVTGTSCQSLKTPLDVINARTFLGSVLVLATASARQRELVAPDANKLEYITGPYQQWLENLVQEIQGQGPLQSHQKALAEFLGTPAVQKFDVVVIADSWLSLLVKDSPSLTKRDMRVQDASMLLLDELVPMVG